MGKSENESKTEPHNCAETVPALIYGIMVIAENIAKTADSMAEKFKTVPGDIALRAFAEAIRRTNRDNGFTL